MAGRPASPYDALRRRTSEASVERYRREAPAPVQLLQALADPLNVVDFGVAPAYEGYRLASNTRACVNP